MAIEDIKTPTVFLINENWDVIRGGQDLREQDLKTFIEGFAKRIKNYKGPYINGQSVINPELSMLLEKEQTDNQKLKK